MSTAETSEGRDVWADVVGQPRGVAAMKAAAASPVHAYLLIGPRGSGKRALARAFAATLLSEGRDDPERQVELALREAHPDLIVVERVGASISAEQADDIVERANLTPIEGERKVLVLDEFHLVADRVGPKLLKTIEEPPSGTHFVVLAEQVPPRLITIASRCVCIEVDPVPEEAIVERLVREGVAKDLASQAAAAAAGDMARARVLATDERLALRREAWHRVPERLDGTGSSAVVVTDEMLAMIDDAMAPLLERQSIETAALADRVERQGERGSGRKELAERHKREQRRYRTDELRFGLLTLARHYRNRLASSPHPQDAIAALEAIADLSENLVRNPNERLQLQALLVTLGDLSA